MGKKKILIISGIVIALIVVAVVVAPFFGIDLFATLSGSTEEQPNSYSSVDALNSGKAYVWHHEDGSIEEDLKKDVGENVFFTCIMGEYNFKKEELGTTINYPRAIWIDSATDNQIPTVTRKDKLIYVSNTEVPQEIIFERFADYGYSIGISNMVPDMGGHYYFTFADTDEDDYKYAIDMKSDKRLKTALLKLRNDLESGVSLDDCLDELELSFSNGEISSFCTVIKSLQSTGQVDEALKTLESNIEREQISVNKKRCTMLENKTMMYVIFIAMDLMAMILYCIIMKLLEMQIGF